MFVVPAKHQHERDFLDGDEQKVLATELPDIDD
jgi:hypothetical protein